jgi:protein-tyrosine kinase
VKKRNINVPRLVVMEDPRSFPAEAYRVLRTNLHYANPDAPLRRVLVTSTAPGEGKSTTLANLGVTLAQTERSVLMLDADLRRPVMHEIFKVRPNPGLTSYLAGDSLLEAAISKTAVPNLSIIPSGPLPPNPAELLASRRMRELLETVSERYDITLVDLVHRRGHLHCRQRKDSEDGDAAGPGPDRGRSGANPRRGRQPVRGTLRRWVLPELLPPLLRA